MIKVLEWAVELCLAGGLSCSEIENAVDRHILAEVYRRMTLDEISARGWDSLPGRSADADLVNGYAAAIRTALADLPAVRDPIVR